MTLPGYVFRQWMYANGVPTRITIRREITEVTMLRVRALITSGLASDARKSSGVVRKKRAMMGSTRYEVTPRMRSAAPAVARMDRSEREDAGAGIIGSSGCLRYNSYGILPKKGIMVS
jgi:hypothetical protein